MTRSKNSTVEDAVQQVWNHHQHGNNSARAPWALFNSFRGGVRVFSPTHDEAVTSLYSDFRP